MRKNRTGGRYFGGYFRSENFIICLMFYFCKKKNLTDKVISKLKNLSNEVI